MKDRLAPRIADLVSDAEAAVVVEDWASSRALAVAALALDPTNRRAREIVAEADSKRADAGGERRQLTVLFCDVVGSTAMISQADPEVVRDVLLTYRRVVDDAVSRADGHIALWIGDGALVYFGHPVAHEDDAWRAVRAGLDIVEGTRRLTAELDLSVRVAIHTGLVIRADMGTPNAPDPDAIVGAVPNLAARLQEAARPDSVLITEDTLELVRGRFSVVPLAPLHLRGIADRVRAFVVQGEAPEAPPAEFLTGRIPLVGRSAELDQLRGLWMSAGDGGSAAALVMGEPGIGKTRLAAELRQQALDDGGAALVCGCSAYHQSSPLHPVRHLIRTAAGIAATDSPPEAVRKLTESLAGFGREADVAIAAQVVGLGDVTGPPELDAGRLYEVTLELCAEWVTSAAAAQPLLLVVDDLQWADPSTLELARRIVNRRPAGLLLLMIARSGFKPPWPPSVVPTIALEPLADPEVESLVSALVGPTSIDDHSMRTIVRRCDGVPLFVEELVHAARLGNDPSSPVPGLDTVPASLRDRLLARLAVAGADFGVVQAAAAIGVEGPTDLLREITGLPDADLAERVATLQEVGVLVPAPANAATFRFHHHLLAELAYDTQLGASRRARHSAVADALARRGDTDPLTLAVHLDRAGRPADAIGTYLEAARGAQQSGAFVESIDLVERAMALLPAVEDEHIRLSLEVRCLETRGFTTVATMGYAAPPVEANYVRCLEILRQIPPRPEHALSFISVFSYFLIHGDIDRAEEVNVLDRGRLDALGLNERAIPHEAGTALIRLFRGDIRACLRDIDVFLATDFARADGPTPEGYPVPNDPIVSLLSAKVLACALAADIAGARDASIDAKQRAARLSFPYGPFSLVFAASMAALAWFTTAEEERVLEEIQLVREQANRVGATSMEVLCGLQSAGAAVRFGRGGSSGHLEMLTSMFEATGALTYTSCFRTMVGWAQLQERNFDAAAETVRRAQQVADRSGVHFWDASLRRLAGEIRLARGDEGGIDDLLASAALAANQGATLFELQARNALVGVTGDAVARKELADVLGRLAPDLDIPDAVEARALLA